MDVGQITVDEEEYAAIEMALSQVACFSQILGARAPCLMGTQSLRRHLGDHAPAPPRRPRVHMLARLLSAKRRVRAI